MGVDVSIDSQSLGQCSEAKCRGYRPNSALPILFFPQGRKGKYLRYRQVVPLGCVPVSITTINGFTIQQMNGTDEHFAVDLTSFQFEHGFSSRRMKFWLCGWVSRSEYETLRIQEYDRHMSIDGRLLERDIYDHDLPHSLREQICRNCPLKYSNYVDCKPSLFSYSELPRIRLTATTFFTNPPEMLRGEVEKIAEDFINLFPDLVEYFKKQNRVDSAQRFARGVYEEWDKNAAAEFFEAHSGRDYAKIAEIILNGLFFYEPETDKPDGFEGERLRILALWLRKFVELVMRCIQADGLTGDNEPFVSAFKRFSESCMMAYEHNLKIRTSF